jgi:hypothetical protein
VACAHLARVLVLGDGDGDVFPPLYFCMLLQSIKVLIMDGTKGGHEPITQRRREDEGVCVRMALQMGVGATPIYTFVS